MTKEERYYEVGRDTILYQNQLHREYSDRAVNLRNVGVAVSVAGAGVISFRLDSISINPAMIVVAAGWLLGLGLLLWACLSVLKIQDWKSYSSLEETDDAVKHPVLRESRVLLNLADNFADAAQINHRTLDNKADFISDALWGLAIVIVCVVFVVTLVFLGTETSLVCESKSLLV